jgi:predicted DNA-binding protein
MKKSDRLYIRISPELKAKLQQLADADGRSVSNYIEQLIKAAIEKK